MPETTNSNELQPTEPATQGRRSQRLQRIQDYRRQALDRPDPLMATLGAANSDLLLLQYRFTQVLNRVLARSARSLEEFEDVAPEVQLCLQLSRQIDRFVQLEQRLGSSAGLPRGSASRTREGEQNAV